MAKVRGATLRELLVSYAKYYWILDEEIMRLESMKRVAITRKEQTEEEMRRWEESLLLSCHEELDRLFDLVEEALKRSSRWSSKALEIRMLLWNWIVEGERSMEKEYRSITGKRGGAERTVRRFVSTILGEIDDEGELYKVSRILQNEKRRFYEDFGNPGQEDAD